MKLVFIAQKLKFRATAQSMLPSETTTQSLSSPATVSLTNQCRLQLVVSKVHQTPLYEYDSHTSSPSITISWVASTGKAATIICWYY